MGLFLKRFILCASAQAHTSQNHAKLPSMTILPQLQRSDSHSSVVSINSSESSFDPYQVRQDESSSDDDDYGDDDDDSPFEESSDSYVDSDDDVQSNNSDSEKKQEDNTMDTKGSTSDGVNDSKDKPAVDMESPMDDFKDEVKVELILPDEEYQFGIHEVYAAMWCNQRIYLEMIRILSIY